jgi:hypothetical protein
MTRRLFAVLAVTSILLFSSAAAAEEKDPCAKVYCSGHGKCLVTDDKPSCKCDVGYEPHADRPACVLISRVRSSSDGGSDSGGGDQEREAVEPAQDDNTVIGGGDPADGSPKTKVVGAYADVGIAGWLLEFGQEDLYRRFAGGGGAYFDFYLIPNLALEGGIGVVDKGYYRDDECAGSHDQPA